MSDEKDPVRYAMAMLIRSSSVRVTEEAMHTKYPDATDEGLSTDIEEAKLRLVMTAPKSVRGSFHTMISYHRWNELYERLVRQGDYKGAMEALKNAEALQGRIH